MKRLTLLASAAVAASLASAAHAAERTKFEFWYGLTGDLGEVVHSTASCSTNRRTTTRVEVNGRMQRGYRYGLTARAGRDFDPVFEPELTPKEMLHLGVFGGKYMTDCRDEFPKDWFTKAKLATGRRQAALNYFGVNASQSLAEWRTSGWIRPQDPRGWFQWYCRYYMGRRSADDRRQIRRWRANARHRAANRNNCEPGDLEIRKQQRQAGQHGAYHHRKM